MSNKIKNRFSSKHAQESGPKWTFQNGESGRSLKWTAKSVKLDTHDRPVFFLETNQFFVSDRPLSVFWIILFDPFGPSTSSFLDLLLSVVMTVQFPFLDLFFVLNRPLVFWIVHFRPGLVYASQSLKSFSVSILRLYH